MAAANKWDVGLEECLSRPPSHVPNVETISGDAKVMDRRHQQQGYRRGDSNLLRERPQLQYSNGSQGGHQKQKIPNYSQPRGSVMQAVFLDTWQKSPGTGVFLPQNVDKKSGPRDKLGSHVVLIPLRVIEILRGNSGVGRYKHSLAENNNNVNDDGDSIKNNEGNEKSTHHCMMSQIENISPELFLPEEWTY